MEEKRIVIIGAGPAGLASAYELAKKGQRPVVLERADKVGGIARTESYRGYLFDMGGHRFFTKIREVDRLWHELMGGDFISVSRMSRIYYRDAFFRYPISFLNALVNLGLKESLLIPASYVKSKIRPYPKEDTFEQWVSNRFGRRLYRTFFKTYTEKVWGIPCDEIRADWAAQRIKGLSLIAAVKNALFGNQKAKTLIDEFEYPLKGPGMMWHRFHEVIESDGGEVRLNCRVTGLECENGRISSVIYRNDKETARVDVRHVISSAALNDLVGMLEPTPPANVLKAASGLRFRSFIIVCLIIDRDKLFPDQWIYIHSPQVKVGRIQNFKNWSGAMVPDYKKSSIGMEYFCSEGDELWNMPDDDLKSLAVSELQRLGLADERDVEDGVVVRQPKAYPVYDGEYQRNLDEIKRFIGDFKNLQTIGRNGMHRYNNMDHSMYTGILGARNTVGEDNDLWCVNEEDEYLEGSYSVDILKETFAKMDKPAFAIATGFVLAMLVFLATIWLVLKDGDVVGPNLGLLSYYFKGYAVTVKGAFVAFGYTFLSGFLLGWLFAYLRNFFLALYVYRIKKKIEIKSLKQFLDYI
jgi:protoporphyrinogen oxidase